jgi:hypothetical protein
MTDQNADFAMKYRVTFTVNVMDPELLLRKAREMEADMTAIENELTAVARRRNLQEDYEPEGIDSIEEALCWVLPGGDDDAECIDIINAEAVAIEEAT